MIGGVGIIILWWILAATVFSNVGPGGAADPHARSQVVQSYVDTGWEFYWRNF